MFPNKQKSPSSNSLRLWVTLKPFVKAQTQEQFEVMSYVKTILKIGYKRKSGLPVNELYFKNTFLLIIISKLFTTISQNYYVNTTLNWLLPEWRSLVYLYCRLIAKLTISCIQWRLRLTKMRGALNNVIS